jgi:hypothetical protein
VALKNPKKHSLGTPYNRSLSEHHYYNENRKENVMTREDIKLFLNKNKITVIIVASLLLLSLVFFIFNVIFREEGAAVRVTVGGEVVGEYPLSKDKTYSLNGGTNILVIEDGVAYVSYANCRTQQCKHMGKIRYCNQFIACEANGIRIVVIGNDDYTDDNGIDFVS